MSTELATQSTALSVSDAEKLARTIALAEHGASALEKSAGENMLKIMIGDSMGIGPGAALRGIHIVKGKPELSGALWGALIDNSPDYKFRVIETTAMTCSLEFSRKEESIWEVRGTETFTMEDAKRAGLAGSQTYKNYPSNMLYWRAMSNGARKFCAGLTMGAAYSEGELSDGDISGIAISEPVNITPHKSDMDLLMDKLSICSGILQGPENTEAQKAEKRRAHKDLLDIQKDQLEAPESARLSPKRMARLDELIDIEVPA